MNYAGIYNFYLLSPGKFSPKPLVFAKANELPESGFSSVYAITERDAKEITKEGTTAGFKGVVWSERLWLDFDKEEAFVEARKRLKEMELDYVVYTTGGRGGHIGILRDHSPSHLLPTKDRAWASAQFEGCDPSIYTHLHLFRLPGTVHEKTGHRKQQIEHEVGKVLILPKEVKVERDFANSEDNSDITNDLSVFDLRTIMCNSIPAGVGQRHAQLVRCIYALKNCRVPFIHAIWWVGEVNKLFSERKTNEEIEQIVRSIYG